jgi:hypothetical protein
MKPMNLSRRAAEFWELRQAEKTWTKPCEKRIEPSAEYFGTECNIAEILGDS